VLFFLVFCLVEGLKAGDDHAIDFAFRGPALLCFGTCVFLAIGFGLISSGESGGWALIAFMAVFLGMVFYQIATSYARRRKLALSEASSR